MRNRHFAPQPWMLATDRMEYTRIYKTTEIPQLLQDFERHLRERRWSGNPLSLRRANETPLKPIPSLFTPEVLEAVSELYATDFAEFGYGDPMPTGLDSSDEYAEPQIAEVERLIERAERINDLALRGQRLSHVAARGAGAGARPRGGAASLAEGDAPLGPACQAARGRRRQAVR